jgi:molybdate transport system regulatory protein
MSTKSEEGRVELRMRLVTAHESSIGPGKIALLESIERTGSLSAAAREHSMSYSRAWKLMTEINQAFPQQVVITTTGGRAGGRADLTEVARELIATYRLAEEAGRKAALRELKRFMKHLAPKSVKPR